MAWRNSLWESVLVQEKPAYGFAFLNMKQKQCGGCQRRVFVASKTGFCPSCHLKVLAWVNEMIFNSVLEAAGIAD